MVAHPHFHLRVSREDHVRARAELDQPHPFAARQMIADLLGEDNPAGQQAGNLLEHHGARIALHGDNVLLVFFG